MCGLRVAYRQGAALGHDGELNASDPRLYHFEESLDCELLNLTSRRSQFLRVVLLQILPHRLGTAADRVGLGTATQTTTAGVGCEW